MKTGYTHIGMVLDRSGSMGSTADDAIGGYNAFIEEQKKVEGEATVSLAQFDHEYQLLKEHVPISEIDPLTKETFRPRGATALRDAVGRMINETGEWLKSLSESERPEKVIIITVTDGGENASGEFTSEQLKQMIEHQTDVYKWEFLFVGANQDAVTVGQSYGIATANAITYAANDIGTRNAYGSMSKNVANYRAGGSIGFTEEDREEQKKAGA
jgi:Mg-chelatase subunit ChlD